MATVNISKADGKNAIHDGIEPEPGGGKALLDSTDVALLLLDHQSGLFQNVKDISVAELRANTTALAKLATLHQIPVIQTASIPDGPNGPLMPEIREAAPHLVYVPRKGEVNAWNNALFVKTVRDTGWSWPACGPASASCFRLWMPRPRASKSTP